MNKFFQIGLLMLGFGVVLRAAPATGLRVEASRDLQLVVVDTSRPSNQRAAIHDTFASGLSQAITRRCGGEPIGVQLTETDAKEAAKRLEMGATEAVLVIGGELPNVLQTRVVMVFSGMPDSSKSDRRLYLVVGTSDPTLQGVLAVAFSSALTDQRFLAALTGAAGKLAAK
jgi:hypothetical protein